MKCILTLAALVTAMLAGTAMAKDLADMVDLGTQQKAVKGYDDRCASFRKPDVYVGMSEMEARCTWGQPEQVNRTRTAAGTREQWVYSSHRYLYIENGRLTAIQD